LITNAIANSSKGEDIVIDFFLGSGSTIIASEKTGRVGYGMEIDPHYCDVIIKRWEDYTGLKAEKL
jgi:DNA modification methylase